MFKKFLSNFFGSKKEIEKTKVKTYSEYSIKSEQTKIPKNKDIIEEVFNNFPEAKILSEKQNFKKKDRVIKNDFDENYEELLEMFEKIDKTDGLIETKTKLSKSTIQTIQKWENSFSHYKVENKSDSSQIIDVVIGFDFGTSSSKIVVNFPFNGNIETHAFPVPKELRANNHEHCWKSILYYDKDSDYFDVIPSKESMIQLTGIKTSLMNTSSHMIILKKNDVQWTSEQISAVYLGILLKLIKGWVISDIVSKYYKDLTNIKYDWELNIGLPAAKIDEDKITGLYKNILNFAWIISETNEKIKMTNYHNLITNHKQKKLNFLNIRPEVAAQSVGFIQSAMLDYGAYTLVDIGASTLDICVFNYITNDDEEKHALFTANVDLLGAESINWIEIVNKKFNKKFKVSHLEKSIQSSFHNSLINTKKTRAPTLIEWDTNMPIIICGGGKDSKPHQNALNDCKNIWNRYEGGMIGNLKFIKPSLPESLKVECSENQYHRLSVAWGLSIEQEEFAKIELPKDIKDLPKYNKINYEDKFISKDQV